MAGQQVQLIAPLENKLAVLVKWPLGRVKCMTLFLPYSVPQAFVLAGKVFLARQSCFWHRPVAAKHWSMTGLVHTALHF
jgi:hypothetical protein